MSCTYLAPNGKPSKLYNGLFETFKDWMPVAEAEKTAARYWLEARTTAYKEMFGDWQNYPTSLAEKLDDNGEPLLSEFNPWYGDRKRPYFDDPMLRSFYVKPLNELMPERLTSAEALKSLLDSETEEIRHLASRVSLTIKQPIRIQLGEPEQGPAHYDRRTGVLTLDQRLQLTAAEVEAFTLQMLFAAVAEQNGGAFQPILDVISEANRRRNLSLPSPYLASPVALVQGFLKDANFRAVLQNEVLPGSGTLLSELEGAFGAVFGFRSNHKLQMRTMFERARGAYISLTARVEETSLDEAVVEPAEAAPAPKEPEAVKGGRRAPFAYLLTGDELLDTYISALSDKIQALRTRMQRKVEKGEKQRLIDDMVRYDTELRELTTNQTIAALINVGKRDISRLDRAFEGADSLAELGENLKLLSAWSEFSNQFKVEPGMEDIGKVIDGISADANKLYHSYYAKYFEVLKDGLKDRGIADEVVDQVSKNMIIQDIGGMASRFIGISFSDQPLDVIADTLIRQAAMGINGEMEDFEVELANRLTSLGKKDLSFMFRRDDKNRMMLQTRYNPELYDKLNKLQGEIRDFNTERRPMYEQMKELIKQRKAAKHADDQNMINQVQGAIDALQAQIDRHKQQTKSLNDLQNFYRENFNYELTQEGRDAFQQFKATLMESMTELDPQTQELVLDEYRYEKELAKYNPDALLSWIQTGQNYPEKAARWFKISPKEQWKNSDFFNKMSAQEREFYDWFAETFVDAHENIPQDYYGFGDYDSDKILENFYIYDKESAGKLKYLSDKLKSAIKSTVMVDYDESQMTYDDTAPLSGREVRRVRFKRVNELISGNAGYFKKDDKTELPKWAQDAIDRGSYEWDKDGYLISKKTGAFIVRKETKEDDPLKIFEQFKKLSLSYKYKTQVEDLLQAVKETAYVASVNPTTASGKPKLNVRGQLVKSSKTSNLENRLDYTIDAFLSDQLKRPNAPLMEGGAPGESKFSLEQTFESINNLTRMRQMGMNLASAATNLALGTLSNFMYAGRDEFFNEKELRWAYAKLRHSMSRFYTLDKAGTQEAHKIALLARRFNLLNNLQESFYTDSKWMEKMFEYLYYGHKGGEYLNQVSTALAMMKRARLKDKDGNVVKDASGKEVNLYEAFEVKDGRLVFQYPDADYSDLKKQNAFAAAATKVNKEIHGDYDILNPMLFKKDLVGRVFMLFRTWMPQAIKQRLGDRYKDHQLSEFAGRDVYREGRWNTLGRLLFKDGKVNDKLGNLTRFVAATAASTLSNKWGRNILKQGGMLDETDQANMYANMKEAWWLMALTLVTASMKMMAEDDDEEQAKAMSHLKFLYNMSARLDTELWFFYSPTDFSKMVRDAVPLWSTLKQGAKVKEALENYIAEPESDIYQRGFRKGDSKFATQLQLFFPVTRQGQNMWSMASQIYNNETIR